MRLSPHEQDRLMIALAAMVARDRMARGLRLNYPEAVAVISAFVLEGARDGRTVAELMDSGRRVLSGDQLMDGVTSMLDEVQVEATFPDGTKLVTIHDPVAVAAGREADSIVPGEVLAGDGTITLFAGAELVALTIMNTGDRPVQVGSHFHLAEANPALRMDRAAARGRRLAIPAGTSVRFEPGIERQVDTVAIAGRRIVRGLRGDVAGPLDIGDTR